MPISKIDWRRQSNPIDKEITPLQVGGLLAYSLNGDVGPFRLALAHKVDKRGFVTEVYHLDGSTKNIFSPFAKRWVVQDHRLTKSPREVLEEIGDIRSRSEDWKDLQDIVKPFNLSKVKGKK